MSFFRRIWLLLAHKRDAELREEMQFHREMLAAERGLSQPEAERAFGNELLLRERARDILGWTWLDDFVRDLKLALRQMRRAPGFTVLAVAILALGIGANTAVFSVIEATLLHPLPYPHPERIVCFPSMLSIRISAHPKIVPAPWLANVRAFASHALYESGAVNLAGGSGAQRVAATEVSSPFFSVMGVQPLGRAFTPSEEQAGRQVAIIGSELARQWGSPANAIGSTVQLNGRSVSVIGVMPSGFDFPSHSQVWVPFAWNPEADRLSADVILFHQIARLRPGVTPVQAKRELVAASQAGSQYDRQAASRAEVVPLKKSLAGRTAPVLWLLLGAVGLVLLIACANVATMQSARALARQKEIAIRTALGAGRGRLLRQVLTECLLLSSISGIAGLGLAWLTLPLLREQIPATFPLIAPVALDGRVLVFALLTAMGCAILFGILPVFHAWGVNLHQATETATGASGERGWLRRTRSGLAMAEIALTMILLAGAGLLLRSFAKLTAVPTGFNAHHLWTAELNPSGSQYDKAAGRGRFYAALLPKLAALPGVSSAALSNTLPMANDMFAILPLNAKEPSPAPSEKRKAFYRIVSPSFVRAMGIPLFAGRDFRASDRSGTPGVVIVNRSLADTLWPGQSAVGRHIAMQPDVDKNPTWLQIVGVVGNILQNLPAAPEPAVYLPLAQQPSRIAYIELRTSADIGGLTAEVRAAVAGVDAGVAVADVATERQRLERSVGPPRFRSRLLSLFAGLALALSAAGIFGVMAYSVTRRTAEIGIRKALGAGPGNIERMIVGQGMQLIAWGIGFGLLGAILLAPALQHFLFGVSPWDMLALGAAAATLTTVGAAACYLPARRAARLDPLSALRRE